MLVHRLKWGDPILSTDPRRIQQLKLAIYALHVATGTSIYCKQVKLATVKLYVNNVATMIADLGVGVDVRKDNPTDQRMGTILRSVYSELDRFEKVPNRREEYNLEMLRHLRDRAALANDEFGLLSALADWFEVGLMAGLRRSEWAQPSGRAADPRFVTLNQFGDPMAFIMDDIRVQTVHGRRLDGATCFLVDWNDVQKVWLRFRTQKNGDNGQEKLFVRNTNPNATCCVVSALSRIFRRFRILMGAWRTGVPLAVYQPAPYHEARMITAPQIEHAMRVSAAELYSLDPQTNKKDLQRWSAHSLRVGACTLLHEQGFTAPQIKHLLRWRSDAFMVYLRNTHLLSHQQNRAFDTAAEMPNFL